MAKNSLKNKRHRHACGLCQTSIKNLGVTIGKREILRNVNLSINCGELTALMGPNGAGKTTLLKAILGEIRYTGELSFLDTADCRRQPVVGYVPQKLDFDPGSPVSVLDLLAAGLTSRPVFLGYSHKVQERALKILSGVQAEHLFDRRLGDLSGGELQRVLLALALEPYPDLLLLDEPVSGIDVQGKEMFYELVTDLRGQYDLSILLVSHDWLLMSHYADRIIVLDKTVRQRGTPREVFSDSEMLRAYGPVFSDEKGYDFLKKPAMASSTGVHV